MNLRSGKLFLVTFLSFSLLLTTSPSSFSATTSTPSNPTSSTSISSLLYQLYESKTITKAQLLQIIDLYSKSKSLLSTSYYGKGLKPLSDNKTLTPDQVTLISKFLANRQTSDLAKFLISLTPDQKAKTLTLITQLTSPSILLNQTLLTLQTKKILNSNQVNIIQTKYDQSLLPQVKLPTVLPGLTKLRSLQSNGTISTFLYTRISIGLPLALGKAYQLHLSENLKPLVTQKILSQELLDKVLKGESPKLTQLQREILSTSLNSIPQFNSLTAEKAYLLELKTHGIITLLQFEALLKTLPLSKVI